MKRLDKEKCVHRWLNWSYRKIEFLVSHNHLESSLNMIKSVAALEYDYNQRYYDSVLEIYLKKISDKVCKTIDNKNNPKSSTVLFYDGFGQELRGLSRIYLDALIPRYRIIYVIPYGCFDNIKSLKSKIDKNGGLIIELEKGSYISQILRLRHLIDLYNPGKIFMYTTPDDVVITSVLFSLAESKITRYQIDLTDHAFWLGANCIDYCIEFREYGIFLANKFRGIDIKKILLMPYYPIVDYCNFQGFPFNFNKTKFKLIVSGGHLYKTIGENNAYYKFVRKILDNHNDVLFWYLGNASPFDGEIRKLCSSYPQRAFWTDERKDIFEILKQADVFINTYPIGGGLLVQYSVLAKTVPIIVRHDDNTSGVLINQNKLGITCENFEIAYQRLCMLLDNRAYYEKWLELLKDSVITKEKFNKELYMALDYGKNNFEVILENQDITPQRKVYFNNFDAKGLDRYLAKKNTKRNLMTTPLRTIGGGIYKIIVKTVRKLDENN